MCALCLVALTCALSCSKSKGIDQVDPPDPTPIELTVSGLKSNDTLRNTVTVEIKAEHSSSVKRIEVFANDELVASATADSLSLSWNTLELPDGTYNVKVVVSDEAGNQKEQATSVVVKNALVKIDRDLLLGWGDVTDYFITDSTGQVIGRANFANGGTHERVVSIYPSKVFSDNKINLTRVATSTDLAPEIVHFVGIKRGTHLSAKNLEVSKGQLNEYQEPIPITVKNIPEYDHLLVSTNSLYYQFPVSPDYDCSLPYTEGSKSLLLIEQNGAGRYGLFDIPAGSARVELDATQANLVPAKKTIRLPAVPTEANITVYGQVSKGYDEFYTFANKKVSGNSVDIFYPENLVEELTGIVSYVQGSTQFDNYYYQGIPEDIKPWDIQANVIKPDITDFGMNASGDFAYYRVLFENKPYVGTGEGYIGVAVFASREQQAFNFPDIANEIDIPGFDLSQFKPLQFQFYTHDVPLDFTAQFNYTSNLLMPKGGKQAAIATVNLRE